MDIGSLLVHSSWDPVLKPFSKEIETILSSLKDGTFTPPRDQIFAALELSLDAVKCVIIGQDPYPTAGNAHGLAFSVAADVNRIPASLRNIFKELNSDLGVDIPSTGNLEKWQEHGVLLLNRVLTTEVGKSNAHHVLGWQMITQAIAEAAALKGAIAILWGKEAEQLAPLFKESIVSAHPSPLSAYRGFFGSKPFTRTNELLMAQKQKPVDWKLG